MEIAGTSLKLAQPDFKKPLKPLPSPQHTHGCGGSRRLQRHLLRPLALHQGAMLAASPSALGTDGAGRAHSWCHLVAFRATWFIKAAEGPGSREEATGCSEAELFWGALLPSGSCRGFRMGFHTRLHPV